MTAKQGLGVAAVTGDVRSSNQRHLPHLYSDCYCMDIGTIWCQCSHDAAEFDDCRSVLIFRSIIFTDRLNDKFELFLVSIAKHFLKNVGDGKF
jgi:hypothetical protein